MIEFFILITFLAVYLITYLRSSLDKQETREMLQTIERISINSYELIGKLNQEHFTQLTKIVDKMGITFEKVAEKERKLYEKNVDKLLWQNEKYIELFKKQDTIRQTQEQIERIVTEEPNKIEQEQEREDPLADFPHLSPDTKMNIQFEGEEQILPIELQ